MTSNTGSEHFLSLHKKGDPLLLANAWDAGTARLFESLGYQAVATTSQGHAGSLGRPDGGVTRDEALSHARELSAATRLPVNADLEHGFADSPEDVADTILAAGETGLAGASIEDWSGSRETAIYPHDLAVARVAAAAEAARNAGLVLTARCENYLHGHPHLGDTVARLQAFQTAGAPVVYAPGVTDLGEIKELVRSLDVPVNVLCLPGGPPVAELAEAGVARISVGSAFFYVALGAVAAAAREWKEEGTHAFWQAALGGAQAAAGALTGASRSG
jgi:2-methylisocitrate lyase-like PEP mutase family enzyme